MPTPDPAEPVLKMLREIEARYNAEEKRISEDCVRRFDENSERFGAAARAICERAGYTWEGKFGWWYDRRIGTTKVVYNIVKISGGTTNR